MHTFRKRGRGQTTTKTYELLRKHSFLWVLQGWNSFPEKEKSWRVCIAIIFFQIRQCVHSWLQCTWMGDIWCCCNLCWRIRSRNLPNQWTRGRKIEKLLHNFVFLSTFPPIQACKYILEQSSCSILVVEDGRQLDKVWALRDQLPNLKKVHIVLLIVVANA